MRVFKHNIDMYATNDFTGLFGIMSSQNEQSLNEIESKYRFNNRVIVV